MNLSQLLNRLKDELGLYGMALPFENTDQKLVQIIHDTSLLTFSMLYPNMDTVALDVRSLKITDRNREYTEYLIAGKNNEEIAYVEDVRPDTSTMTGWSGYNPIVSARSVYDNIIGNASLQLIQNMVPAMTFKFLFPNRLRLFNALCSRVIVDYGKLHSLSLSTIPPTAAESFYKLASLDCKSVLYNFVKHYNEVSTAHGRIDLKIEDWADAQAKRDELVEKWEDTYHLDRKTVYWA